MKGESKIKVDKTKTGVEHKTLRKVKAYATNNGEAPLKKRRLESFATAYYPSKKKKTTEGEENDGEAEAAEVDEYQGKPEDVITGPEFLSDKPLLTVALREAKVSSLSKMTLKVADAVISSASSSSASSSNFMKFVVPKMSDRQYSLALSLVALVKDKSIASGGKKGAKSAGGQYPIVIASRHKQDADATNTVLRGLQYLIGTKFKSAEVATLLPIGGAGECPSVTDVKGALFLDASSIAEVDEAHWKRCTQLIIVHEGGPDSNKACVLPSELNPKASKFVMVAAMHHLGDAFVSGFVASTTSTAADGSTAVASTGGPVVTAKILPVEGIQRLQSLWSLVTFNAGFNKKKVVVSCGSRPSSTFHNELFNALEFPDEGATFEILCDWETNLTDTSFVQRRFSLWDSSVKKKGCVLITSACHIEGADLVVQYDPAPLSAYKAIVEKVAASNTASDVSSSADRKVGRKSARNDAVEASTAATNAMQLVFVIFPCEVKSMMAALPAACSSSLATLKLEKVTPPAVTRGSLTGSIVQKLVQDLFALNMKAFEGYKNFMAVYARLTPSSIYNVRALNIDVVSSQFGLADTPMLDLRLKDTPYRPKENYAKAVLAKDKELTKELRRKADLIQPDMDPIDDPEDEQEEEVVYRY